MANLDILSHHMNENTHHEEGKNDDNDNDNSEEVRETQTELAFNDIDIDSNNPVINNNNHDNTHSIIDEIEGEEDQGAEELKIEQEEQITYQVTLPGFWQNFEKRYWKSNRRLYHIDENNIAQLLPNVTQVETTPPLFAFINPPNNNSKKRKTQ